MEKLYVCALGLFGLLSCSNYDAKLETALAAAGENRPQLEHVLAHYQNDALKRKAAEFLISHMTYHGEHITMLYKDGMPFGLNTSVFASLEQVNAHIDSMVRAGRYQIKTTKRRDVETITSDYLIAHIDNAFEVWKKPWSKEVDFDSFCNYILPYRAANEPLSAFRDSLRDKYIGALDSLNVTDPIAACAVINRLLKDRIKYDLKATYLPYARPIEHIYASGVGSCDEMCLVGLYVMRALGIPVAKEVTVWARMSRGHAWCSVQDQSKKWHAFGAGEDQPDSLMNKFVRQWYTIFPKVYRETYAQQDNPELYDLMATSNYPNAIYTSFFLKDATADYLPPLTVKRKIDNQYEYSFLCVYNSKSWQPIDFARTKNGQAVFEYLGTDFLQNKFPIVYAHGVYDHGRLELYGNPFVLYPDGQLRELTSIASPLVDVAFSSHWKGEPSRHRCWDSKNREWIEMTPTRTDGKQAFYSNVPKNTMFLRTVGSGMHYSEVVGCIDDGVFVL